MSFSRSASRMFEVETLSARMSTDRTPLAGAATAAPRAQGRGAPSAAPQRPGRGPLLADGQRHAAAARPAQADGDVVEIPFVAALLVVDDQLAVLQTDFVEVLSVEPGEAQAVN